MDLIEVVLEGFQWLANPDWYLRHFWFQLPGLVLATFQLLFQRSTNWATSTRAARLNGKVRDDDHVFFSVDHYVRGKFAQLSSRWPVIRTCPSKQSRMAGNSSPTLPHNLPQVWLDLYWLDNDVDQVQWDEAYAGQVALSEFVDQNLYKWQKKKKSLSKQSIN